MDAVIRVVEVVIGIGLLIMIHELGHFLSAKWVGVRVDKFAIGWGPRLFFWRRGETEYSVRCIPFGGFVKMAGEDPHEGPTDDPRREFRNQPPGKKAVVLLSGVVMNFVLGIILFSVAFGVGLHFIRPLIGVVHPQGPAEKAGLLPGDEIVAINGKQDLDWDDVLITILMSDVEDNISLTVLRGGKRLPLVVQPRKGETSGLPEIGIEPATGRTLTGVDEGSPAAKAGLKVGDVMDTIDGIRFLNWPYAVFHISSRMGQDVVFRVERAGKPVVARLVPRPAKKGSIGVTPRDFVVVEGVAEGTPAARAGLKPGDEVRAVNGKPTPTFEDLVRMTAPAVGRPLVYTIRRADRTFEVTLTPETAPGLQIGQVGIRRSLKGDFVVGEVAAGSPAESAGIRPGDVLTRLGRTSLEGQNWSIFQALLDDAARKGTSVTLGWRRGGAEMQQKVLVRSVDDELTADIGISVEPTIQRLRKPKPWAAPVVGLKKSWQMVQQVYLFLRGMLTRRISPKHLAGPVGIFQLSYRVTAQGVPKFLFWLAMIGVNVAVVNLLPMPPLDGGLLVLTLIEKLRGKALSEKWLVGVQLAGWCLVILLLLMLTYNDILRMMGMQP